VASSEHFFFSDQSCRASVLERILREQDAANQITGVAGDLRKTPSEQACRDGGTVQWMETMLHERITEDASMLVKDLMTKNVTSCHPENNLAELAEVMWNQRCGALPILDDSGRVMGIITDRDICIALGTRNLRASEVLAREVSLPGCASCGPENDVRDALGTIGGHEVGRLPVVDEGGHLVGILSVDDIVYRAGAGRSDLSDREIIDALKALREERIQQIGVVTQEESDLRSDLRMPLNYQDEIRFH